MSRSSRAWLVLPWLAVAAHAAIAEEVLVPEGEPAETLQGTTWSPLVELRSAAASPDGRLLASVARDGSLRLWDAVAGREQRRFAPVADGQESVAFSGDGHFIATGAHDGTVQLWDTSGTERARVTASGPVIAIALSQNGGTVFFGVAHQGVSVWQPAEKSAPSALSRSAADIRVLEAAPEGRTVAAGLRSGAVQLFDADALKLLRTIEGLTGGVSAAAFSSDGHTLAVGTDAGTVELASVEDGHLLRKIQAHSAHVTGVRFAADGVVVATGRDGAIGWFNATTGEELRHAAGEPGCCTGLATVDGGRTVVLVSPRALLRRDVISGTTLPELTGPSSPSVAVAIDEDGSSVLAAVLDGSLRLFDVGTGSVRHAWSLPQTPGAIALSGDGRTVYTADDRAIVAWDASGEHLRRFEGHEGAVLSIAVTGDGAFMVSGGADHTVRLWDAKSGAPLDRLQMRAAATTVAISPDGVSVAAIGGAGARLFNRSPEAKSTRLDVQGTPSSLSFSQDGKRLAVGLSTGGFRLFDVAKGIAIGKTIGQSEVSGIGLTSDGKQIVTTSANAGVQLWKEGGAAAGAFAPFAQGGACVALSSSNGIAVAGTDDGAFHVWKLGESTDRVVFRQAGAGWVSSQQNKVLRTDDGRWVVRSGANGELADVPPAGATKADLSLDVTATEAVSEGARTGRITVKVVNKSASARAYWVQLAAGSGVPDGFTVIPSEIVDRIEPGGTASLTATIAWSSHDGSPAPRDVSIPLRVVQPGGDTAVSPASLHVRSARIAGTVTAVEGGDTGPFVRLEVTNEGDAPSGAFLITPTFLVDGKPAFTAPSTQVPNLAPQESTMIGIAAAKDVATDNTSLKLDAVGSAWPTEHWSITTPLHRTFPWVPIAIGAGVLLLLLGVGYRLVRVTRDPIVMTVSRNPTELARYGLEQLPDVDRALRRARRLGSALTAGKISPAAWRRAVGSRTPDATAAAFAEAVGAKLGDALTPGVPAWSLELPSLEIRFSRKTALIVCSGKKLESAAAAALAATVHTNGAGPAVALALDLTAQQNGAAVLRTAPRVSFVVLGTDQVRDILLAAQPLVALQMIISAQRPLTELSPYQTSSGVDDEGLFFGRERELRAIADRALHNFILVAPRQMGKSTLLKAAQRKLAARADVEVHLITLLDDDLMTRVGRALNRPRPENPEQFMELAGGTRERPKVWLIDEADSFVSKDARARYPVAQAMRTLAEEGRAYFVLAGFWHLYAAVHLNPTSPLRNFGEKLRLEPLDRDSARALATRPMEALGLKFQNQTTVERLLDETAGRAHLVTTVCQGIIERLGANDRVITEAHLDAALYGNPAVADEFKYWRREPLGRALLRASLIGQPPTRAELRGRLDAFGLDVTTELYDGSLDRLELGYLLVANEHGKLVCPVPLLRRIITEEGPLEEGVRRDVHELAALQRPEQRTAATG